MVWNRYLLPIVIYDSVDVNSTILNVLHRDQEEERWGESSCGSCVKFVEIEPGSKPKTKKSKNKDAAAEPAGKAIKKA